MKSVVLAAAFCGSAAAFAQPYPIKPVRMVVPLVPGGSTDALARVLAQKMSESLGQQIVVDNRGGASGNIGTELVARAAPDGYTIMAVSMTLVVNPFIFPKVNFDPVKDFAPISRRSSLLPDVPTIAEAGVPGYAFTTWYGVVAPARTAPQIITLLNEHVVKAARSADVGERFAHEGAELIASSPAQFAAHIKSELERWGKVVKESDGLRAD